MYFAANLFEAIEGDDFEQCRYLLENNDVAPDLSRYRQ